MPPVDDDEDIDNDGDVVDGLDQCLLKPPGDEPDPCGKAPLLIGRRYLSRVSVVASAAWAAASRATGTRNGEQDT